MIFLCLPLINSIALFLIFYEKEPSGDGFFTQSRNAFVKTLLSIFFIIFAATELLSLCNKINTFWIVATWTFITAMLLLYAFKNYISTIKTVTNIYQSKKDFHGHQRLLCFILLTILIPIIMLGFYYPAAEGDSFTYHLPRVGHWIQNNNIDHYPTCDIRQLFHQPLAEYAILHLQLLSNTDFFFPLIQLFSFLGYIILAGLIVQVWLLDRYYQILAMILALTIPMGMLQATSTQTDCVASFFLISFIYFFLCFISSMRSQKSSCLWGSLSLGLGLFTKLTVGIFAFPFLLWGLWQVIKNYKQIPLKPIITGIMLILIINGPFYYRNYQLTNNIFGDKNLCTMMRNEEMSTSCFMSNIIRNLSLHLSLPLEESNKLLYRSINKFHQRVLRLPSDKQEITFSADRYRIGFFINESLAGNFILTLIIIFMFFYLIRHARIFSHHQWMFLYTGSIVTGFIIFCTVFKWQIWGSRLQLPLFVIATPLITYFLYYLKTTCDWFNTKNSALFLIPFSIFFFSFLLGSNQVDTRIFLFLIIITGIMYYLFYKKITQNTIIYSFGLPFILLSFPYVYFNSLKPILLNTNVILASRKDSYLRFWWDEKRALQYTDGVEYLKSNGITTIALDSNQEIPLRPLYPEAKIESLSCYGYQKNNHNFLKPIEYQAILAQHDSTVELFNPDDIKEYKILGDKTRHGNWKLIIFKQPMTKRFMT